MSTKLNTYDGALSGGQSIEILSDLALMHCVEAGQYGLEIASLIKRRDFAALCAYELRYDCGIPVDALLNIRQALGFFTKLEFLDIGVDKEAVARTKFFKSEHSCLVTNRLFDLEASGDFHFPLDVTRVLDIAERKIASLLDDGVDLEALRLQFGPGATTSVPKRNACAREKLSAVPSCSANFLPLAPYVLGEMPGYTGLHSKNVDGVEVCPVEIHEGRISFVPKNAKTYRTVMTEPTLNALVQSGFGSVIEDRLLRVGQDIHDQARNQILACEGSLLGNLATLDLSSASDCISTQLVCRLLPYEWFAALALCRTESILIDGQVLRLQKFSSMGNGFTFPLQTLLFWAMAKASSEVAGDPEYRVSVYGDDIIVGSRTVSLFRKVLHCTGFQLNDEKSYWNGSFRESCGCDYFSGIDIRPFYVKKEVTGEILFALHNFYARHGNSFMTQCVLRYISEDLRIYGPDGFGDGHLLGDWVPKPHRRDRGYSGYVFDTYTRKPRYHFSVMPGDGVLPSYSAYVREDTPLLDLSVRTFERRYRPDFSVRDEGAPTMHRKVRRTRPSECSRTKQPDDLSDTSIDNKVEWYPVVPIPGSRGYRRISIYTLST